MRNKNNTIGVLKQLSRVFCANIQDPVKGIFCYSEASSTIDEDKICHYFMQNAFYKFLLCVLIGTTKT